MRVPFPFPLLVSLSLFAFRLNAAGADVPLGAVHYLPSCETYRSRIASNGRTFYGAWTLSHVGFSSISGHVSGGAIGATGALMTPTQHVVAVGPANEAVASDGNGYLVATNDRGTMTARLVDANGLPRGGTLTLATGFSSISIGGPTVNSSIGVSWNGAHFVVVGTQATKNADQSIHEALLAVTIGADGVEARTRAIAESAVLLGLAPAANGHTLALMQSGGTIQSVLLDDALVTTTPVNVVTRANVYGGLASSGGGFLAVWSAGTSVEAISLDASGMPAGTSFVVTDLPAPSGLNPLPAVTWDGSSYLIVWWAGSILGARSNGGGASPPFVISNNGANPSLATNADGDSVVLFGTGCGAISSRIVRRGALEPEPAQREVSLDASPQSTPSSTRVSGGTQVAWEENRAGNSAAVMSTFVAADGSVAPARQLTQDGSYSNGQAELVSIGSGSAVVWNELGAGGGGLRIQRFDGFGNPLTASAPIGAAQVFGLSAAANGTDVGVAFTQAGATFASGDSYVAVADAAGNVHQAALSEAFSANSTIAPLGDGFLVVWRENSSTATPLFSAVVDRTANVVSKQLILADSGVPYNTALIANGVEALLVWSAVSDGRFSLTALRLDASGTALSTAFPLASSPYPFLNIRITREGDAYFVTYLTSNGDGKPWEVQRTTVRGGAVSPPVSLVSSDSAGTIGEYVLSGNQIAAVVIARSAVDLETNGVARLYWRPLALPHPRAAAR